MADKSFAADAAKFVRDAAGDDQPAAPEGATTAAAAPTEGARRKRLTVEIPTYLHRLLKMDCAARDTTMAAVVQELLEAKYQT